MNTFPAHLIGRAFAIADEAVIELLHAHGVPLDGADSLRWGLVDANAVEVSNLAQCDPAILEALAWLTARGIAILEEDNQRPFIRLLIEVPPPEEVDTQSLI